MIGIKENGIVKVWINSNWSLNSCKKAKNEMSAVEEIIMLVSGFCKDPQVKLLQDIRQIPNINFETAIKCI